MYGLFVQRHAVCAAVTNKVSVLYVHPCNEVSNGKNYEIHTEFVNEVFEVIVYYRKVESKYIYSAFLKVFRYIWATFLAYSKIKEKIGKPDIVHINILTRASLIAVYLKIHHNIPFLITEHWSRYLPAVNHFKGLFRKIATKWIVKNAECITVVSNNLKEAMLSHGLFNHNYLVLANVVDTNAFKLSESTSNNKKKRIIHISCFEERSKNINGILRVLKRISDTRNDFECLLVGDGIDFEINKSLANSLDLKPPVVVFTGLKTGDQLVELLSTSDFLLLFSNFENMPVVISESFACGIPVIAPKIGGIPEMVFDWNGILIEPGNENELYAGINSMLNNELKFDKEKIREFAVATFGQKSVQQQLSKIYSQILHGSND